jgi:sulfate permease, SulP family
MVGAFLLLGFAARLGILTRLLSAPVLTGYLAGSGIVIALSQLPKVTGISTDRRYPGVLPGLVQSADTLEPWAIGIAIGTTVVSLGLSRVARQLPAAVGALGLATVFVTATGLADSVAVVGHVEAGLPQLGLPGAGLGEIGSLLAPAGSIALLVFASTVLTGEALAARDRERVRPNRELLALGAANLGAGLVQGFPANGSDSRSFAAAAAGARTQLAGVVAAGLVVVTLLFLTPLFHDLPAAALGAVVIVTALRLVDGRELRRLWHVRSSDFVMAIVTLAGVLILGVLWGIAVGVVASLLEVLRRAAIPHTAVLGRLPGGTPGYRDVEQHEGLQTMPGLIVYRFDAPLFFANADLFRDELLRLVLAAPAPVRQVIVNAEAIYDIDTTGIQMLERLHDDLAAESVRLGFARLKSKPRP